MRLKVGWLLLGADRILFDELQNVFNGFVERFHGKGAVFETCHDLPAAVFGVARHFEIEPRFEGSDSIMRGAPIGHHKAVKAPLFAENIGEEPLVLRTERAIDGVVGAHEGRGLCGFHDALKCFEVDLAGGALIADAVAPEAVVFRIVEGKVLDGNAHALALNALDFADAHLGSKQGIFGIVFEVPPAQRVALDVDARTEDDIDAVVHALFGDALPHLSGVFGIPARGDGRRRREGCCRLAHRDAVVSPARLFAEAVRAVCHRKRRDTEAPDGSSVHEIDTRNEPRLFFGREFL